MNWWVEEFKLNEFKLTLRNAALLVTANAKVNINVIIVIFDFSIVKDQTLLFKFLYCTTAEYMLTC